MKRRTAIISGILFAILLTNGCAFGDFKQHFDLGQSYLSQYQYSGAITEFKNALRINYLDTSARIGLVNAYLARGAEYANKDRAWAKAADDYRSALFYLQYYPTSQTAINNSAQAISQVNSNIERCLKEINFSKSPQNRFETAKKLRAEGNFSAAGYEFVQALGDRNLQKNSFEQIGDIMNLLGNKPKAEEYYKKAVAVSPNDLDLRLTYAKILDTNKKNDEALKEYSYVLERSKANDKENLYILERTFSKKLSANPNNANLNANMGAVLQKEGRLDEALTYYKQSEALDPSNINTRINVGTLYQQKGDYKTAIKAYESVLILYPENVNAILYRSQCLDKLGDTKAAQDGFKKVLALDPDNTFIKQQMVENVKKTSTPTQFVEYVKANFANNNPSDILYDYAIELHKDNKSNDAIYMYKEAINLAGAKANSEMYENLALVQAQNGDYGQSIETLQLAQTKFPGDKSLITQMKNINGMKIDKLMAQASEYFEKQDYENAAKVYLSITPATADSMLGAAGAYQSAGDKDTAIEYYKKALSLKPVDSNIAYYIAVLYGEKEDYATAKNYLQKAIKFNKNNKEAIQYLASIEEADSANLLNNAINKYEQNDYDGSLKEFNQILSKDPNNAYALYYRGMIYDSQAKHNEAIADLKKAYDINKEFTICNYMIATNYDSLGKYEDAYKYFDMYASSDAPEDDYKEYAKARMLELKDNGKSNNTQAKK